MCKAGIEFFGTCQVKDPVGLGIEIKIVFSDTVHWHRLWYSFVI